VTALQVSCAAEGGEYIAHSAAMLHSVLAQAGSLDVQVHYLHGPSFPHEAQERLGAMVEDGGGAMSFIEIPDAAVAELPVRGPFTKAMWYRILLPQLLPDVDRVLYLDVDTIASDSLEPLWALDLADSYLAAVTNVFQHNHLHRPAELGLPGSQQYFNSGVLLMNLAAMRRDDCTGALFSCAIERADGLEWPDQDALNLVLGSRRLALHPRWNCMNSVLTFPASIDVFGAAAVEEARTHPGIRHFEGPLENKPWHYLCAQSLRELYFEHRRATPWPDLELEGATPANVARRAIRDLVSRRGRVRRRAVG
jgi:lipopolysaccharide biosynthesis glycosyltransferase